VVVVDVFERSTGSFHRERLEGLSGMTELVVEEEHSKYIPDDRSQDEGGRSWLGVPVRIYDSVEGVLAIQSNEPYAFGPEHIRLLEAISAQAAVALQNARLYELAMVDGLTGLFVRRYFDARLGEEVERSARFNTEFCVVMLDIDDFKKLNDTHGHTIGDRVLRAVSAVIAAEMRGVDTAARYGGEEVALILPRTSLVDAYNVAERIGAEVAQARVEDEDGNAVSVTVSMGVAGHPESGAASGEALVGLADRALYRAKRTGKNRVELYWSGAEAERPKLRPVN
jgi:diguanylate cyclase (GGDEF)-like protein